MRLLVVLPWLVAACALVPGAEKAVPIEGSTVSEPVTLQMDPKASARRLKERFPGVQKIDAVEVAAWAGPRSGPCWSELDPLEAAEARAEYELEGGAVSELESVADLRADGWTAIYRNPRGEGLERVASFRSLDLTYRTRLHCACAPREKTLVSAPIPLTLRLRWTEGEMPAIAASAEIDGKREGLLPTFRLGQLASYEFEARGAFPENRPGRCTATLALTLLLTPPIG